MRYQLYRRRGTKALLVLSLASTAACNSLLDVESPGRVPVDALADPALIPGLAAAAIQTFQCGAVAFAATGGVLSGEYWSANAFVNNHIWEWRGVVEVRANPGSCDQTGNNAVGRNSTFLGFYTPLQQARFQLDDTFERANAFTDEEVPNRGRILTEMRAYAGYAYTLLAEGMCSMALDRGPEMTRAEVLAIAEERFTDAIARATAINDASLLNMARVGRARVRLDLGNMTGAAADAILVPAGYVRNAEFATTAAARENRFFNLTVLNDFLSVGPTYRNLTVDGTTPDPRVRAQDMNRNGPDNATRMWRQLKFTTNTSSFPIASWNEAQLIYAEAVGGQAGFDAINRVRQANGVPQLAGPPPTGADFTNLVLEERRRQLFSEGQRYPDMLRHNLPFQSGVNRKGQTYSSLTCVPLPDVETLNNPNFQ